MSANRNSRFGRMKVAVAAGLLLGLAACTNTFRADVSRFQSHLPAPSGQTFAVVADNPALAGGIEFSQYARLVEARMAQQGYVAVPNANEATLIVRFDYGVDNGRERVRSTGFARDPFWGPWYGFGHVGRFGHVGHFGRRGPWGYGWYDPFFDSGRIDSYTVYTSGIDMKIDRKADGARLFEGKAEAVSSSNRLPYLVPNLVDAMFTGFPGNSGETVRITVAPEKQASR